MFGRDSRVRTCNNLVNSEEDYQLSYIPIAFPQGETLCLPNSLEVFQRVYNLIVSSPFKLFEEQSSNPATLIEYHVLSIAYGNKRAFSVGFKVIDSISLILSSASLLLIFH
jgi:hypothetical protein